MSEQRDLSVDDWEAVLDYAEEVQVGLDRLRETFADDGDSALVERAAELWDVLDEFEDVLDTVDLSEAATAVDVDDLPDAIDIDDLPSGLVDAEESAVDLTHLGDALDLRDLWESVDLTDFGGELTELEDAIDAATGDGDTFENVIEGPRIESDPATRQAYMAEMIAEAAEEFREVLLASHEQFRELYQENQERFGKPGRQPDSLNPTAVSTLPPGPVPDSASTRASTVPGRVRHSRADYQPERIYGQRFVRATSDDEESTAEPEESPSDQSTTEESTEEESMTANQDDVPHITVHGADE